MGGDGEAFCCAARSHPCRLPLPENGPRKEERVAGMPQAYSDKLGEKDTKTPVEMGRGGRSYGHALSGLPSVLVRYSKKRGKACSIYERRLPHNY